MGTEVTKTFGRNTIYANYTEKSLLRGTKEERNIRIVNIINASKATHEQNRAESVYLRGFMYGDQDIKFKEKFTRTEINNQTVENWCYAFIDWGKSFLLGEPLNYIPYDDISEKEIEVLNKFFKYEDKHSKDMEILEDMLCCGRGFRYSYNDKKEDEDEAPFEIINSETMNTEVVYSSRMGHEQLLSYVEIPMQYTIQEKNIDSGVLEEKIINYSTYQAYTRNKAYTLDDKEGTLSIKSEIRLTNKEHPIVEYFFNRQRMGWVELAKDIFNDINYIESLDKDDMEQFVNSIMVFTNAEVTEDSFKDIKRMGAVSINSSDNKRAAVEVLQSKLKSLDTQTYYLRKISALHSILSVPMANNDGDSNAETGQASLTGQGFTSASVRIKTLEIAFTSCDRTSLKNVLKSLKKLPNSGVSSLKISDIDSKFQRDMSENLLVKTQALNNLKSAFIPNEIANSVINLFSDPTAVTKMQNKLIKEKEKTQALLDEVKNTKVKEDNVKATIQKDLQGQ